MKMFEQAIKQRAYDQKFMLLAKILDYANMYRYKNELDRYTTMVPHKWIIVDVQDTEEEIKKGKYFGRSATR